MMRQIRSDNDKLITTKNLFKMKSKEQEQVQETELSNLDKKRLDFSLQKSKTHGFSREDSESKFLCNEKRDEFLSDDWP